jgi:pyruvate formate lyase activating enzyme
MIIDGFNKLTLLDYPDHIACIIFTRGCNFRCPYCHNSSLIPVDIKAGLIDKQDIFDYLEKRKGIIEGIVVTGGEPTIQTGLIDFLRKLREYEVDIKLDTNGLNTKVLKQIIDENLVDYVAMDLKHSLDKYEIAINKKVDTKKIKTSINLLNNSSILHEFRTTLVKEYHSLDDIKEIAKLTGNAPYYLQNFKLSEDVIEKTLHGFEEIELEFIYNNLKDEFKNIKLR